MTETVVAEVRRGYYLDSVALMRLSRAIAGMDGVLEAALMMGSPSNLAIMRAAALITPECDARPNDLVVALRASDKTKAAAALQAALAGLEQPKAAGGGAEVWSPRSIAAAVGAMPLANFALISVPGDFAAAEARKALRRGLNVMMFSDNVTIEDELSLKQEACELGLLMMGPDCGTAIINGAPLAFANRVRPGNIGIIGASGTGTQEISCLVSEAGGGISHAIGVGGRDLKREIGGITTLMAMDLLDADPGTNLVVLISKPPHPDVARKVIERLAASPKPYVVCFLGAEVLKLPNNARQASNLHEAAELALRQPIGRDFNVAVAARTASGRRRAGRVEGLFSGGTLAAEAQLVLRRAGRRVVSNVPVLGAFQLGQGDESHDRVIDLGDDEYTRGRPHPMIDPTIRDDMLVAALRSSAVGAVLVDLVIGFGAHSDPAGHLVAVVATAGKDRPPVISSVTGSKDDPQGRERQIAALEAAGIVVAPSNAQAAEVALALSR